MKHTKAILCFNDVDSEYLPEDQPESYLSDEFLLSIIESVKQHGAAQQNALDTIIAMEKFHRQFVCGQITATDEKEQFEEINDAYRNRHKVWLHETQECILFYNLLNGSEVLSL